MSGCIAISSDSLHMLIIDRFSRVKLCIHHADEAGKVRVEYLLDDWSVKQTSEDIHKLK